MLTNLSAFFTSLGWSRDDLKWIWTQLAAASAAIASGVFDLTYWSHYVGVTLSINETHVITVAAIAILWISGRMSTSQLHSAATMKVISDTKAVVEAQAVIAAAQTPVIPPPPPPIDPKTLAAAQAIVDASKTSAPTSVVTVVAKT